MWTNRQVKYCTTTVMTMYDFTNIDLSQTTNSVDNCESYFYTGAAYDTESSTIMHTEEIHGETHYCIDSCFVYHIQFAIDDFYYPFRTYRDFLTWFDYLIEYVKQQNVSRETPAKLIIWVANLSHEWAFMKNYIKERYNITKCFAKERRAPLLIEINECIQIRESIGLFGHSLADIAKNWCAKYTKLKGDLDYNKVRHFNTPITPKEQQYMKNDVLILTEMHHAIFKAYMRENGVIYIPYTVSGFVRLKLKKSIAENEELTIQRENIGGKWLNKKNIGLIKNRNQKLFTCARDWNILRQYAFAGGVVGSNIAYVGKTLKGVKCADITSDYPYQMLTKKYPHGKIQTGNKTDYDRCKKEHKPYFILAYIDEMTAKTNHAVFSEHKILNHPKYGDTKIIERHGVPRDFIKNNGKLLTGKNLIVAWNDVDEQAYNLAYDIKGMVIIKVWFFPWGYRALPDWLIDNVIRDYITKAKLKASGQKDTIEYKDAKRDVNTYFGTLATRCEDIFDSMDILNWFTPTEEYKFSDLKYNTWLNPYWAFYVTSYARKMLIERIVKYPDAIVQYDTDSLYYRPNKQGKELEKALSTFNQQCVENNVKKFRDIPDAEYIHDLGTWDFDEPYDNFICMGAKKYIKEHDGMIETVIAGLPKSAIPKQNKRYHIKRVFDYYNPILKETDIIIKHMFVNKFASVYDDTTIEKYVPIKDYKGETVLQPVTSFHALAPIDFTLSVADDYLKQIKAFQKQKTLTE